MGETLRSPPRRSGASYQVSCVQENGRCVRIAGNAMTEQATTKSFCNNCHTTTTHRVLASSHVTHPVTYDDPYGGGIEEWAITSEMLVCAGCGWSSLRDTVVDDSGDETVTLNPPKSARLRPKWLSHVPLNIREVMWEVYQALDSDASRLALMGARAVMDMLIVEQVGDVGSFPEKLKALEERGMVSRSGREVLSAALDAGSAVAHRGVLPSVDDTTAVLDIVEHVLQATYQLGTVARRLRQSTLPRPPRVKPSVS